MFCSNCGKEIPDGIMFCNFCGAAQNTGAAPQQQRVQQPQQFQQPAKKNNIPIIIVAVVAVIAVIIGAIFIVPNLGKDKPDNGGKPVITEGENAAANGDDITPAVTEESDDKGNNTDDTTSQQQVATDNRTSEQILEEITTAFDGIYDSFAQEYSNTMSSISTYADYEAIYPSAVELYEALLADINTTLRACEDNSVLYISKVAEESGNDADAIDSSLDSLGSVWDAYEEFFDELDDLIEKETDDVWERLLDNEDGDEFDIATDKIAADYDRYINDIEASLDESLGLLDEILEEKVFSFLDGEYYSDFDDMINDVRKGFESAR